MKKLEIKKVWVFECWHDLCAGIHKNIVSGPNPTTEEKKKNSLYGLGCDDWDVRQEEVLFIEGTPQFLHSQVNGIFDKNKEGYLGRKERESERARSEKPSLKASNLQVKKNARINYGKYHKEDGPAKDWNK